MPRSLTLLTLVILAVVLGPRVRADQPAGRAREFQGYWMGVDPVDGGDARRSLVQAENGKYILAARDTVLSLCGGTEHGFGSFDDGEVISRTVMESTTLTLRCFNNGASLVLHTRFELVDRNVMIEHATLADGTPVSTIVLHRVSQE